MIAINFPDVKVAASKDPTESVQATLIATHLFSTCLPRGGTGAVEDRTIDGSARAHARVRATSAADS